MVAYSFRPQFVDPIRQATKRQTIRANGRRRHAQPGDMLQLYSGMRTRHCFKIIPDVQCSRVRPVMFDLRDPLARDAAAGLTADDPALLAKLVVGYRDVTGDDLTRFAQADGFPHFTAMVTFWLKEHGSILFEGVCIEWERDQCDL